jgi:hypothetical protein
MKYALFLLALVVGSASGVDILDAIVMGKFEVVNGVTLGDSDVNTAGNQGSCGDCLMDGLYKRCVEDKAVARGAVVSTLPSRRELRGDRNLYSCSVCTGRMTMGSWCWVKCGQRRRRLSFSDEHSSKRSLAVLLSELEDAALVCYKEKAAEFPCLGVADGLTIEVEYEAV